ncbi:MAG: hypothetical protein E6J34_10810 [Chloroflexi bacterium]|nr:MAG: hypothetical protein E6J34_10810 [Chloroflexota bacterium]
MSGDIGQELGNYRLVRLLGQGSFANVYLGEHIQLHTQVAIKALRWRLFGKEATSFLNEAQTITQLVHPNIVRVLDFGIDDTMPFLVMDYTPGGTFRHRYLHGDPLPPSSLSPYVIQIATALQYAHDRGLVHRNVRPENILLGANNKVLVSDFGLELEMQSIPSQPRRKELSSIVAYMAPEQLQDAWGPASDQYALGVMAYEWLTGSLPFQGTFLEVASQQLLTPAPSLREKVPAISPVIDKVVLKALSKNPDHRFASIRDFAFALQQTCKISGVRRSVVTIELPAIDITRHASGQLSARHSPQPATAARPTEQSPARHSPRTEVRTPLSDATRSKQVTPSQKLPTVHPTNQPASSVKNPITLILPEITGQLVERSAIPQQPTTKQIEQPPVAKPQEVTPPVPAIASSSPGSKTLVPMTDRDPLKLGVNNRPLLLLMVFLVAVLAIGSPALIFYLFSNNFHDLSAGAVSAHGILKATADAVANRAVTTHDNTTIAAKTGDNVNTYVPVGSNVLVLDDPLQGDNYNWQKSSDLAAGSSCTFSDGAYKVMMPGRSAGPCFAQATSYHDFTYQIQMRMIAVGSASSGGGIVFRGNRNTQRYYVFAIYGNGLFAFSACIYSSCTHIKGSPAEQPVLPSFNKVLGQLNTIAVVAKGNTFSIYVNHQRAIGPVQDATAAQGMIGVFAEGGNHSAANQATTIAFNNAKVWKM